MLLALSIVAYLFVAHSERDTLQPLLGLPEGRAAYAATMRRVAATIALFDLPLLAIVGGAAYVLARVSMRPLALARAREERFAADAAHELRTPLATIAAVAQAARAADHTAQTTALTKIADVALDASALLGDLLALMRDAPGERRLHEPVEMGALVGSLARDERLRHERTPAVPIAVTSPPGGAYVIGDERALRQLVGNLVRNALRHAVAHVSVDLRCEPHTVVLTVRDDGPGVAPADRERIFDRFFKADANSPGSGLGLAICRHIATAHGATIELQERSCFVARFPRAAE